MNHKDTNSQSRRDFLRWSLGGAAAATGFGALTSSRFLHAAAQGNPTYRALVVVYLSGGNDSCNLIVPTSTNEYAEYLDSRQNLAVPANELLPITPLTPDGSTYGIHPSAPEIQSLFQSGKLAVVANTGNLVEPVTRAQYIARSRALPPQLFSHSDQQKQSMHTSANVAGSRGWGGEFADRLAVQNGNTPLSPSITLSGSTPLLAGLTTQQYHLSNQGSVSLQGFYGGPGAAMRATFDTLRNQTQSSPLAQQYAATRNESIEIDNLLSGVLAGAPPLVTTFPAQGRITQEMEMVAKMIQVQSTLAMERQVFFVRMPGFDTHAGQIADQPALFADLSATLAAFQAAMEELNAANEVTVAVVSEFGRSLSSNGQGTDHGWGGHLLAMGGSVVGGDIYGTMPSLALGGPDDATSTGRLIPTQSTEQYAATIGRWLGIDPAQLPTIFPNLGNFPTDNLGFLA